jgi:predicted DNA-binding transcriptional regulator YafY
MLAHQLLQLPPFAGLWRELRNLFEWLEGVVEPAVLGSVLTHAAGLTAWTPPPTIRTWGGAPVESLRFAAQNRLIVEFDYVDERGRFSHRRVEPYSLNQTADGNIIISVFDLVRNARHSFRVDRIQSPLISNETFEPRFATEVGLAKLSINAPASTVRARPKRRRPSG